MISFSRDHIGLQNVIMLNDMFFSLCHYAVLPVQAKRKSPCSASVRSLHLFPKPCVINTITRALSSTAHPDRKPYNTTEEKICVFAVCLLKIVSCSQTAGGSSLHPGSSGAPRLSWASCHGSCRSTSEGTTFAEESWSLLISCWLLPTASRGDWPAVTVTCCCLAAAHFAKLTCQSHKFNMFPENMSINTKWLCVLGVISVISTKQSLFFCVAVAKN